MWDYTILATKVYEPTMTKILFPPMKCLALMSMCKYDGYLQDMTPIREKAFVPRPMEAPSNIKGDLCLRLGYSLIDKYVTFIDENA